MKKITAASLERSTPRPGQAPLFAFAIGSCFITAVLWAVCLYFFFNAQLLDLPHFLLLALGVALFCLALIVFPLLTGWLIVKLLKKAQVQKGLLRLICAQMVATLLLGCFHFVSLRPVNTEQFATSLSVTALSKKISEGRPGLYFISSWNETGTISNEATYFAQWLDLSFDDQINTPAFYCHSPEKGTVAPEFLDLMEQYKIDTLPAVIAIDHNQAITCFENLSLAPISTATDQPTQLFKEYWSERSQP